MSGNINRFLDELFLTQQYRPIVCDEFFTTTTKLLDTKSYIYPEFDELSSNITVMKNQCIYIFTADRCNFAHLNES